MQNIPKERIAFEQLKQIEFKTWLNSLFQHNANIKAISLKSVLISLNFLTKQQMH